MINSLKQTTKISNMFILSVFSALLCSSLFLSGCASSDTDNDTTNGYVVDTLNISNNNTDNSDDEFMNTNLSTLDHLSELGDEDPDMDLIEGEEYATDPDFR